MEISEKEWQTLLERVDRLEHEVRRESRLTRSYRREVIRPMCEDVKYLSSVRATEQRQAREKQEKALRIINRLLGGED